MGKKAKTNSEVRPQLASFIDELLNNGNAVFAARTREELDEMVKEIPSGVKFSAGPIGQCYENDTYTIRIDLI